MTQVTFNEAIRLATFEAMTLHPEMIIIGEGINDPKRIFKTTNGLVENFGSHRVIEAPIAENGITGMALGLAIAGHKTLVIHQRCDFSLYSFDQIINNLAKWKSMFNSSLPISVVIRMIVGQGWGQGNQHTQNLQAIFAHFPGLKVITPSTPYSAKGLLTSAFLSSDPVIFIEHRWCQEITSEVPRTFYELLLDQAEIVRRGDALTIITNSYWTLEAMRIANFYSEVGIEIEIVDLRALHQIDIKKIMTSLEKTKRGIIIDGDWFTGGISAEIFSEIHEQIHTQKKIQIHRMGFKKINSPSSPHLAKEYFLSAKSIAAKIDEILNCKLTSTNFQNYIETRVLDKPDNHFSFQIPSL